MLTWPNSHKGPTSTPDNCINIDTVPNPDIFVSIVSYRVRGTHPSGKTGSTEQSVTAVGFKTAGAAKKKRQSMVKGSQL